MHRLVGEDGRVQYGCLDGSVEFNAGDFILRDLFGHEIGAVGRHLSLGGFTFLGITGERFMVGLAAVRRGYAASVFGFHFDFETRALWERSLKAMPWRLDFPLDPDESSIRYRGRDCRLDLVKSHAREVLEVEARFGSRLQVRGSFPFGLGRSPLRVVNPGCADPNRFMFTEKFAPLVPSALSMVIDGTERVMDPSACSAVYDWSGGYFSRRTGWLWAAMAGTLSDGRPAGANFAALVNDAFYPENAFWVDGRRTRVPRVIFEYDPEAPAREDWRVRSEDGQVDLRFRPLGERNERTALPFLKVHLRQFMGEYSGWLRDDRGRSMRLDRMRGLAEIQAAVW